MTKKVLYTLFYQLFPRLSTHLARLVLLLFAGLAASQSRAQQFYVSGKVTGSSLEPLSYVSVYVRGSTNATQTNDKGFYKIRLASGTYEIVYSLVGYKVHRETIVVNNKDQEKNVILEESNTALDELEITDKKTDRAEEIVKHVLRTRQRWVRADEQSVTKIYIRATEETERKPSKKPKKKDDESEFPDTSLHIPELNMAEINITRYYKAPDKVKEERTGVSLRGDPSGLFYLSTTEGDFDFYRNLISIKALSETPFLILPYK